MRNRGPTGIWEIFMPGLDEGALYKFEILSRVAHQLGLKSDPYGFSAEVRPNTASVVFDIDRYKWNDSSWLGRSRAHATGSIRPCRFTRSTRGSWQAPEKEDYRWLTYRELADRAYPVREADGLYPHRAMPMMEHPVRRVVGLSDRRILRGDQPFRHARMTSCTSSTAATRKASA